MMAAIICWNMMTVKKPSILSLIQIRICDFAEIIIDIGKPIILIW